MPTEDEIRLTITIGAYEIGQIREAVVSIIREELKSHQAASPAGGTNAAPNTDLFDTKALAKYLSVSPLTIFRLRDSGRLGFYRVGRRVLFSHNDHVLPYLRSSAVHLREGRSRRS